jgi:hypothetical protein
MDPYSVIFVLKTLKNKNLKKLKMNVYSVKPRKKAQGGICIICNNKLKLKAVYFVGYHEGVLKNLIWRLKFHSSLSAIEAIDSGTCR